MDNFWKFATVAVAMLAAFIAYLQLWLAKERLKLDLFQRRFAVFAAARLFLSKIMQHGTAKMDDLMEYRRDVAEASFLFEEPVSDFLTEIDRRALHVWSLDASLDGIPVGAQRSKLVNEKSEALSWLMSQLPLLKPTFEPYMKFSEWHRGMWRRIRSLWATAEESRGGD